MDNPLVSIIIPAYNAEKYLAETINSALNQTWLNKEIIVIDNGSTDGSATVAKQFGDSIIFLKEDVNKGAGFARNKGLEEAAGDYIQFLDADDLLAKNKIELQLKAAKNEQNVLIYGNYVNFFDGDEIESLRSETYLDTDFSTGRELLYNLYGGNDPSFAGGMVPQHSWLTPRSVIEAAGYWDTTLSVDDDGEFFCRVLLKSAGAKYVEDAVCYYRRHRHQNNLSSQKNEKAFVSAFEAIKLKQKHLGPGPTDKLLSNQAMHLLANIYPQYPVLCRQIEAFIKQAGGSPWLPYREGIHKKLRQLFGWKAVRLMSYYKNLKRQRES